jgi:hypothetical protein
MLNWKRQGKIFNPADWPLPLGCTTFAQSPQALELPDSYRVYFSTRSKDATGKYLSHIAYADFSKDWTVVKQVSQHVVLPPGGLGCYDEHGVFPLNVFRLADQEILGFIGGWNRRVSVSVDGAIGLCKSTDGGETFLRCGAGPILGPALHEPCLVGDPFVKFWNGMFHMWYIFGQRWQPANRGEPEARIYRIGYARSKHAVQWERFGKPIIADVIGADECQALPTVFRHKGLYHMVFCYRYASGFRNNPDRAYRLGYAYSSNLTDWVRADAQLGLERSGSGWDSQMMCYPHAFQTADNVFLLYNGDEFGKFGFGLAKLQL